MTAKLYWIRRHVTQATLDLRFAAKCWWLNQQINFCEWRMSMHVLLSQAGPATARVKQGSRCVAQPL